MNAEEARQILALYDEEETPITVPASVLSELTIEDLHEGTSLQVGTTKEGVIHLGWSGRLCREGDSIFGEADHTWTRKYWYSPLGLEHKPYPSASGDTKCSGREDRLVLEQITNLTPRWPR